MKKITIKDIAEKAGVSISTVSLVINNKGYVSDETRKKINRIIKKYNYYPSSIGKNLALQKTGILGAVISDKHFFVEEQFYTLIYLAAVVEAGLHDRNITLSVIHENKAKGNKLTLPRFIMEKQIDGIIVMGDFADAYLDEMLKLNIPIVMIDYYSPNLNMITSINTDNYSGGLLATNHLLSLGHKKIAFIGGMSEHPSIIGRYGGYADALRESGLAVKEDYVFKAAHYHPFQFGYEAGRKIVTEKLDMTAVFASNDMMALGLMNALQEAKVKIPDQLAIVGFDDIASASLVDPKLTSVRIPKKRLGELGVQKILATIDKNLTVPERVILPVELKVRKSCGGTSDKPETNDLFNNLTDH